MELSASFHFLQQQLASNANSINFGFFGNFKFCKKDILVLFVCILVKEICMFFGQNNFYEFSGLRFQRPGLKSDSEKIYPSLETEFFSLFIISSSLQNSLIFILPNQTQCVAKHPTTLDIIKVTLQTFIALMVSYSCFKIHYRFN